MSKLLLKFVIFLEESGPLLTTNKGPLFHRWLPDGQHDSIMLDTKDPDSGLEIWFERRGVTEDNFIRFDYKRREVNPNILKNQGFLDAGPLMGLLTIENLPEVKLAPIRENRIGDVNYIALGKKIVKKLLYPPISRFIGLLRVNYGQYWIRQLEKWDSRKATLGAYCKQIKLEWSLDGGNTWTPFVPDEPVLQLSLTISAGPAYLEYLTKEDWHKMEEILQTEYEPSPAAFIIARSHQLLDQGDTRNALIDGVTALELATEEFMRRKRQNSTDLGKALGPFWRQSPKPRTQMVSLAVALGVAPIEDIELAIEAIETRNDLVHEGIDPPENAEKQATCLLNIAAAFLSGPPFRFPTARIGNTHMTSEQWEKAYKKKARGRSQSVS